MGLHLPGDVARGVAECMPTVSLGRAFVLLWDLLNHDFHQGCVFHERLLPMLNFLMQSVEMLIACEKLLLVQRGMIRTGYCREPAFHLDRFQLEELARHAGALPEMLPHYVRVANSEVNHGVR
jgi:dihydrodipicolinate synthase/N-acetylneuraminate lyase